MQEVILLLASYATLASSYGRSMLEKKRELSKPEMGPVVLRLYFDEENIAHTSRSEHALCL